MEILFVGGGTLGSVTPLLAVAEELNRQSQISNLKSQIRWWGTRAGPERAFVEAAGISFSSILSGKLRRYWDIRNLVDPFIVLVAFVIALVRFVPWRPSVVVGAGGFVQVPVGWAAALLRIPVVIHQADVRPGLANRLLAPFAAAITVAFAESGDRLGRPVTVTGMPVRPTVLAASGMNHNAALQHFALNPQLPTVLVIGGGTGSVGLNTLVVGALPELLAGTNIIHVTGRGRGGDEMSNVKCQMSNVYRQFELLTDDLPYAYAAADLVIARAGMGTIAELAALGKSTVLIPMPGTHQEENAHALAARGAVIMWPQAELDPHAFAEGIKGLLADSAATDRGVAFRRVLPVDAASRVAGVIFRVAGSGWGRDSSLADT